MVYVCEFELFDSGGFVDAVPLTFDGEGTFGSDMEDAVESAADWLAGVVDDHLVSREPMPPMGFGHEPRRGGRVIAVAVSRELGDIPAMTAADAARELGVSRSRVSQLIRSGLLVSWVDGTRRMVSRDSVEARKGQGHRPGRPSRERVTA